ncbi:MAG: tetrahydrofolate synthase [Treponema sp.]|jgi:dihydrofolate synthase/folylpolyglutamate synthase|nr:tetrahydrofolate synthase [Treponema sp.]
MSAFRSAVDVFDWLSGYINLERGQQVPNWNLERMRALAALAGHPETCAPALHIAGSKGKGSVTAMLAASLEAAGIPCARYLSPHVQDPRERIARGAGFFPDAVYAAAGEQVRRAAGQPLPPALFPPGEAPTYFELLSLWFFLCAREARCEALAVETGLGGRLDATNIITPRVSIITPIELEHTAILGPTLAAIAREKAGIIKAGRPVVCAPQAPEALAVLRETAAALDAPFFYLPDCAKISDIRASEEGTFFHLDLFDNEGGAITPHIAAQCASRPPPGPAPPLTGTWFTALAGRAQAQNAALALLALGIAFPGITRETLRQGLARVYLPARFERYAPPAPPAAPIIRDGAHTPESIRAVTETFTTLYGRGGALVFGCAADKNAPAMARLLCPAFSRVIITAPGTFRAGAPDAVYQAFTAEAAALSAKGPPQAAPAISITLNPDTQAALAEGLALARSGLPLLVTGSFYLAGALP